MNVPDPFLQPQSEYVINCTNNRQAIQYDYDSFCVTAIGKLHNGKRYVSQSRTYQRYHGGEGSECKPQQGLFYSQDQVEDQTRDSLHKGNQRDTYSIRYHHSVHLMLHTGKIIFTKWKNILHPVFNVIAVRQ